MIDRDSQTRAAPTAAERGHRIATAVSEPRPGRERWTTTAALACFFLSGAAGLVYEICWIRRASLVFGSTQVALSTVLAVFFLGLAVGSWICGRVALSVARPLRLYSVLEVALGGLALASIPLFHWADQAYGAIYGAFPDAHAALAVARIGLVSLILLPPTVLMGVLERGRLVELRGASYRTRHLKRAESDRSPLREGAIVSGNQVPDFPEPTRREYNLLRGSCRYMSTAGSFRTC